MAGAKCPRHGRCETQSLLRNFQIRRFDLVPDAVSASRNCREIRCSRSDERIKNRVAGKREQFDEPLGQILRKRCGMSASCRFAFDVDPGGP